MTSHPSLFNGAMVRAILAGNKRQTRRILKDQPTDPLIGGGAYAEMLSAKTPYVWLNGHDGSPIRPIDKAPKYKIGDWLWVREAWRVTSYFNDRKPSDVPTCSDGTTNCIEYLADNDPCYGGKNRPSIFMPKWASRISLKITEIKIEPIQEIYENDAINEGIQEYHGVVDHDSRGTEISGYRYDHDPKGDFEFEEAHEAFRALWDSINGKPRNGNDYSWDANPYVVALTFEPSFKNINEVMK